MPVSPTGRVFPLVIAPDARLREASEPVAVFDAGLHTLLDDMAETLSATGGIGLAAVQIGFQLRALLVRCEDAAPGQDVIEVINPEITAVTGYTRTSESCLSVPNRWVPVNRPSVVNLTFQDRDGALVVRTFTGRDACVVQHEIDHLNGKTLLDRMSSQARRDYLSSRTAAEEIERTGRLQGNV